MAFNSIILFLAAFLGGLSFFIFPDIQSKKFDNVLLFAGSYLLSITILHILPEVYSQYQQPYKVGILILAGFLLQILLGSISSGIEHGHLHKGHVSLEGSSKFTPLFLLLGLGIHSFLEGTILANPVKIAIHNHSGSILLGIILHKIPAAIALMAVLSQQVKKRSMVILFLFLFSIASPLGLILTAILGNSQILSTDSMALLYALVCGSFLHISTTIFFESSPHHHLNLNRLMLIFIGAGVALMIEIFL